METKTAHTPGPLTFDGCGINGGDKYRSRIATFAILRDNDAQHYGPLFASAPDLLAERDRLREVNVDLVAALKEMTDEYAQTMKDAGVTHYPETLVKVRRARAALAKVKGE